MSRTKLLLDVVENMRILADSIQTLCDAGMSDEPQDESTLDAAYEKHKNLPITLEQVRGVLAKKSQEGKTEAVRNLLKTYGANKLSEVKVENYRELLLDAEGI